MLCGRPQEVKEMERVECLYRVSTKGQVDHDDIPMQRIECRKFAEAQGWIIIKELCEKGVSGFKVAANDRDAIQELRDDAVNQRFDMTASWDGAVNLEWLLLKESE